MKHTKDQINKIAKQVLDDIGWTYDKQTSPRSWFESVEDQANQVSSQKNHPKWDEYVAILFPLWTSSFDFPPEDGWEGRNTIFLNIRDEDGEPYEISHKQARFKIIKNDKGKYEKAPIK